MLLLALQALKLALRDGIKIGGVGIVHDLRDVGRLIVPNPNAPINGAEERV